MQQNFKNEVERGYGLTTAQGRRPLKKIQKNCLLPWAVAHQKNFNKNV